MNIAVVDDEEIIRQRKVDAVLVFITGIKEYVFEAFDASAFRYLLKPIEEIFSAMFQGYCLQYFYGSFLESRVRKRYAGKNGRNGLEYGLKGITEGA